ncbi:uncharacterized protein L203_104305 [Cryptococcus depauperatus CBS 7841]|uniref:Uncharacterized protein n=1 Tax=Cryptococcus depauperatus CBS 7841 TaxID=1295531 RepID=A0A1E3I5T0_9TREE|nr:hypothetical protein L203_05312 [Cryptococcus depauperatus CBS 7841]
MNAFRTLPILHRPSRSSSPAPPTVQPTNASGIPASSEKRRSRSLSRQVADKVSSLQLSTNGNSTPTNGSMAPSSNTSSQPVGKRLSPPGSRSSTPNNFASPLPTVTTGEGPANGYMDVISLRLNETVNKAIAGVDFNNKKGFKKGNGLLVGEAVVKELPEPPFDAYLMRAILRTSVRSLSIYTTRLESLLLPSLTDASFFAPFNFSPSGYPLNPVQYFALSIAHAAWETCETLELTLESGKWPKFVCEALRPIMDKLDLVVSKVVQSLLLTLKKELIASLARTEGISPPGNKPIGLTTIPTPTSAAPLPKDANSLPSTGLAKEQSASGVPRTLTIPSCLQSFASRVDGARKIFEIVAKPCADDGEGWITSIVVAVIWKGICVIAEMDPGPLGRPPSPSSVTRALAGLGKEKEAVNGISSSSSLHGVTAKLASSFSLPSRSQSRASSPPRNKASLDPITLALYSLEALVKRLVTGLVQSPSPADYQDEHLAREALSEAVEALKSFRIISSAMYTGSRPSARLLASARRLRDDVEDPVEDELDNAMEDIQPPILFSVVSHQANMLLSSLSTEKVHMKLCHPSEAWGRAPGEYERQVLATFSSADDSARQVALAMKPEIERVLSQLSSLVSQRGLASKESKEQDTLAEAVECVKCLGVLCDARCGVKAGGDH